MPPDEIPECWLCNVIHDEDGLVEIGVHMPTKAVVCIDCLGCVLEWGEVPREAVVVALDKVENHSIAALRTKAASSDRH